jgi:carbon-monoxide dehydrogenase large subunit
MAVATPSIGGLGESVKRKEDARFIRGRGNYVDDIVLPGMLHMAILRSPHAHARITAIDTSAAGAVPGVVAVVTGELLAQHKLAWMPTLSGDTQAVLATDKVRFQGQEIACVIAETKYIAEDAVALIRVDYEVLPAVTTPQRALQADAPVIRDEKEGQTDNHIYHWETGDKAATDAAFASAAHVVKLTTHYPRCHPAPLETCGIVADVNSATGKATLYMTSQAPHAHRTLFAIVAGLPEQQIRIISPDIGGGFGNKVPIYPGYVVATAASLLIGRPVKWIEDRTENLISTGFARDYHMTGELAFDANHRMTGLRASLLSDNGAFFADAQPSKFKAGLFHIVSGSYDIPAAHVVADGAYTNKAPGAWPTAAPSGSPRRRTSSSGWWRAPPWSWVRTLPSCGARTSCLRRRCPTTPPPASCTTVGTTTRPSASPWRSSAMPSCARNRRRSGPGAS